MKPLKWERGDNYYIKSGSYTISKAFIADKVIYELWIGSKWLFKDNTLEKVKEYAERKAV